MSNLNDNRISTSIFGQFNGHDVNLYTFTNNHGNQVSITNYGGIITSWLVKDRAGVSSDVIIGFDSLAKYIPNGPHFGSIIGRYANRIANGKFTLDGKEYTLARNNGNNSLHGGIKGFDKFLWEPTVNTDTNSLTLSYMSQDGEEGYPGNLQVTVTYQYTDTDELKITYSATTDKPTPINLTVHPYFNLTGDVSKNILGHVVKINAAAYTPVDSTGIPTGEVASVVDTPFDFRTPRSVGERIGAAGGGYDHNYVLNTQGDTTIAAAIVREPTSGRKLEVYTDEPGLQFYTGNSLDGSMTTEDGKVIGRQSALCLETQHFPDSPNKPAFPSTILRPGEEYLSQTIYKLSAGNV